ncbi:MAG: hypothetical protein ACLFOY_07670 [Desulfatibacillaceae bacterium]
MAETRSTDLTQVEMTRLRELAQEGYSVDELMQKLDIKDRASLKQALTELMAEEGANVNVPDMMQASPEAHYTPGGIRIDPAMLEGTGFEEGDRFSLSVQGGNLVLTRVKP